MSYWIQYHSYEGNGNVLPHCDESVKPGQRLSEFDTSHLEIGAINSRRLNCIEQAQGESIFLIVGINENGLSTSYYLWCQAEMGEIWDEAEDGSYVVELTNGWILNPLPRLNDYAKFSEYIETRAYSHGLKRIDGCSYLKLLQELAKKYQPKTRKRSNLASGATRSSEIISSNEQGAGFGDSETNRKVETAAIETVTNKLTSDEWNVESVESQKQGYDLLCRRYSDVMHVEVKGVTGGSQEFFMTSNEKRQAEMDEKYHLYVVTAALSDKPKVHVYSQSELCDDFEFKPVNFRVSKRKKGV